MEVEISGENKVRDVTFVDILSYIVCNRARLNAERADPPPRVAEADLPDKRLREVPIRQLLDVVEEKYVTDRMQDLRLHDGS